MTRLRLSKMPASHTGVERRQTGRAQRSPVLFHAGEQLALVGIGVGTEPHRVGGAGGPFRGRDAVIGGRARTRTRNGDGARGEDAAQPQGDGRGDAQSPRPRFVDQPRWPIMRAARKPKAPASSRADNGNCLTDVVTVSTPRWA